MKPKPDEHDIALFREATRGVKPLRPTARVTAETPRPRPRARFSRGEQSSGLAELPYGSPEEPELAAGDPTLISRPGVPPTTLRKLRRGQYRVQAELDVHGLTVAEATLQLREFLLAARHGQVRCLRIVHGKGLRSGARGAVLRRLVNGVLRHTAQVVAVTSARPIDGGTGAVYVLLDGHPHASSASTTAD